MARTQARRRAATGWVPDSTRDEVACVLCGDGPLLCGELANPGDPVNGGRDPKDLAPNLEGTGPLTVRRSRPFQGADVSTDRGRR